MIGSHMAVLGNHLSRQQVNLMGKITMFSTEALKEFNTGKGESLTLGGTLVETPEGMEVDGAGITGWEEVKGDDVNADL